MRDLLAADAALPRAVSKARVLRATAIPRAANPARPGRARPAPVKAKRVVAELAHERAGQPGGHGPPSMWAQKTQPNTTGARSRPKAS